MTRWYTEKKTEHFYKEAKRVGYRARSAFKLQQIQNRFHLIPKGGVVIDLGAAPGGWSQVAKELVGKEGLVMGADLSSIRPLEDVIFIQGDITKTETIEKIKEILACALTIAAGKPLPQVPGEQFVHSFTRWLPRENSPLSRGEESSYRRLHILGRHCGNLQP